MMGCIYIFGHIKGYVNNLENQMQTMMQKHAASPTNLLAHLGPQPTSCPEHGVKAYLCLADFCFFGPCFSSKSGEWQGQLKTRIKNNFERSKRENHV